MPEPTITAFYGFKGGTGRSFLLASCAVALAALGRRVLVMDWDLEAPGVGDLFDASGNDMWMDWRRHPGTLDLFLDKSYPPYATAEESGNPARRLHDLLFGDTGRRSEDRYLVDVVPQVQRPGRLSLIGPGQHRSATQYFDRLLDVDWSWYFENNGTAFLELLSSVLKTQTHFDHVLIDGRTGYSPSSISAIRYVADHVCVIGTYSFQSIDGVARVWPLLRSAEGGAELTRRLVLARKPMVTDPKQIADFKGKDQLLEEYGIPEASRLVLPIVSNLHGGDSHLWSRYELFARAAAREQSESTAADDSAARDTAAFETESLYEYLRSLAKLLREVVGVESVSGPGAHDGAAEDVPLLWVPGWWREVSDFKFWSKEYNLSTAPWKQQSESVDTAIQAITVYLSNETDQTQRPPSVDPLSQNQEKTAAIFEPWSGPGEQTYKSLPARALLAARANQILNAAVRPSGISDETWRDRLANIRLHYGVDVSPTSTALAILDTDSESARAAPDGAKPAVAPGAALSERITEWDAIAGKVYWGLADGFSGDVRRDIAQALDHAASVETAPASVIELKDILNLHRLSGTVLKTAGLLHQDSAPLSETWFRACSDVILRRCLRSLTGSMTTGMPVDDVIRLHRRILYCVQEVIRDREKARVARALAAVTEALPVNPRPESTVDWIIDWSGRVLKAEIQILLPISSERTAAVGEIARVTSEAAALLGELDIGSGDATAVGQATDLWDSLNALCRTYNLTVIAVPFLLSAVRLTRGMVPSLVEGLELCFDALRSPSAQRASEEYAKRIRAELADAGAERAPASAWRVRAALRREWWRFGYSFSVADGDGGEKYGSYREALNGLNAWMAQAKDEPGSMMRAVEQAAERFRKTYRFELGDTTVLTLEGPDTDLWTAAQRGRLLIALGQPESANRQLSTALERVPSGLEAEDPDAVAFARLQLLKTLTQVVAAEPDDTAALYDSAQIAIAVLRRSMVNRPYPFDRRFERLLRAPTRRPLSVDELGLSSGEERPALFREELALCHVEYAEVCLRCGNRPQAHQAIADALAFLDIDECGEVPARGFTGPLSIRMALPAALALALKSKLLGKAGQGRAMDAALTWGRWDCAAENHGAGRKVYYGRLMLWCADGARRRNQIKKWLGAGELRP